MLLAHSASIAIFPIVPPHTRPGFPDLRVMQSSVRNRLLAMMSPQDLALLQPKLAPIDLDVRAALVKPGQSIEYVYFIETGLASEIAVNADRQKIEVAHVGPEGLVGKAVVLGLDRTPMRLSCK